MELIKQGDIEQFEEETKLFHFEFTDVCNQHCSYCIEGNFCSDKPHVEFSKKEDLLSTLDKIFDAYDDNIQLGFILVGGEPTCQKHFIDVVNKIKSRKNAFQILTTNFTQSVEYYRELDIALVTSLHLDSHEPKEWLDKTLALNDLVAHTRIMAHPQKMDKVKEAYNLFLEKSKAVPMSFAVEEISGFTIDVEGRELSYSADYSAEDLGFVKNCKPVDAIFVDSLNEKMGILKNLFYRSQWIYKDANGQDLVKIEDGENNLKGYFCERSMVIIRPNGDLLYGFGCKDANLNIFKSKKFPKSGFKTVICDKDRCPMSMGSTIPKYKEVKYAPDYAKKTELIALKIKNAPILIKLKNITIKALACLILSKKHRKSFRNKFI